MTRSLHNIYDVLYMQPKLHKKLPAKQEELAKALVASGRMRLDADNECNFTRQLLAAELITYTFTHREVTDPKLLPKTRSRLIAILSKKQPDDAKTLADQYIAKALEDLKKRSPVKPDVELMLARALVLCNALPVIELLHLEEAEIFISYGHSVGDVMDVVDWQKYGNNSGMQALGKHLNAVYVSCGGHPFLSKEESNLPSDGFPALARMMVIAAQETGHNGDMIRDANGIWVGRHSAIDWNREPSEIAGKGRLRDIANCEFFYREAQKLALNPIVEWERHLKFYRDQKVGGTRKLVAWAKSFFTWQIFRFFLIKRGMKALTTLPRTSYPATQMHKFFNDMLFNLSPQAEVYQRSNPKEEEAISCIEAVARVPQQVVKWGHDAVYCCTPNLYVLYYQTIVPACEQAVQRIKNKTSDSTPPTT